MLPDSAASALDRDGFVVLEGILQEDDIAVIQAAIEERLTEARRDLTRRFGGTLHLDLIDAGPPFDRAWNAPQLREAIAHVIGDQYRIHVASYRAPGPGYGAQALHTDDLPIGPGGPFRVASAVIPLTEFNEDNGTTRFVPGSHLAPLHDAPKEPDRTHPRQRLITAPAGSAIVFNGHAWHSGTRNVSEMRRDSLQLVFRRA